MHPSDRTYINWSGGKDSTLALYHTIVSGGGKIPELLLTSVNTAYDRISMHGVRSSLLDIQAQNLGISLRTLHLPEGVTMDTYDATMREAVTRLYDEGFRHSVFGDIYLEDLRLYREQQLAPTGIMAHFPLWRRDTGELLEEFLDLGFKTVVVCVRSDLMDRSFAGRVIDRAFVRDLPSGIDPCGENGEFHTFVFDGPIFSGPVPFTIGETVYREYRRPDGDAGSPSPTAVSQMGFWFCDLVPG